MKKQYQMPEYLAWYNAWMRCNKPSHKAYKNYGGRGIKMCDKWAQSFETFFKDMGPRPSADHSLGRIDNNKGYEPKNCKWETRLEQYNHSSAVNIFGFKAVLKNRP